MATMRQTESPVEFHWSADSIRQMAERYEHHIKAAEVLVQSWDDGVMFKDIDVIERLAAALVHATLALALRPR